MGRNPGKEHCIMPPPELYAAIQTYCKANKITFNAFACRALRLLAVQLGITEPKS